MKRIFFVLCAAMLLACSCVKYNSSAYYYNQSDSGYPLRSYMQDFSMRISSALLVFNDQLMTHDISRTGDTYTVPSPGLFGGMQITRTASASDEWNIRWSGKMTLNGREYPTDLEMVASRCQVPVTRDSTTQGWSVGFCAQRTERDGYTSTFSTDAPMHYYYNQDYVPLGIPGLSFEISDGTFFLEVRKNGTKVDKALIGFLSGRPVVFSRNL